MAAIAPPSAKDTSGHPGGRIWHSSTATSAETPLPITTDHGCAKGLEGTAKTSTALAPKGAMR